MNGNMLTFATKYGGNVYSQFGEDGIIQECLNRINPSLRVCTEFGGHDGTFCSNTALLRDQGWTSFMYDLEACPPHVMKQEVTPENVNQVVRPCSVLSIDVDGNDYNIWKCCEGKPDIAIIEINSSLPPFTVQPISHPQHGTQYTDMVSLGISKGYFLLCHTANCVFVLNKHRHLFPEIIGDGLSNYTEYFNPAHL